MLSHLAPRPGRTRAESRRRAFTLLELVVTLVIVAVLAALAVPTYVQVTIKAKDQVSAVELEALQRQAWALAVTAQDNGYLVNDFTPATATAAGAAPGVSASGELALTAHNGADTSTSHGLVAVGCAATTDGTTAADCSSAPQPVVGLGMRSMYSGHCVFLRATGQTPTVWWTNYPGDAVGCPATTALATLTPPGGQTFLVSGTVPPPPGGGGTVSSPPPATCTSADTCPATALDSLTAFAASTLATGTSSVYDLSLRSTENTIYAAVGNGLVGIDLTTGAKTSLLASGYYPLTHIARLTDTHFLVRNSWSGASVMLLSTTGQPGPTLLANNGNAVLDSVITDGTGNAYVSWHDTSTHAAWIDRYSGWGDATTRSTIGTPTRFANLPTGVTVNGMTCDASTMYALDQGGHVYKLPLASTGQSAAAWVSIPANTANMAHNAIITSQAKVYATAANNMLVQIDKATGAWIDTVGVSGSGNADGIAATAHFSTIAGLVSRGGTVYMADQGNNQVRVLLPAQLTQNPWPVSPAPEPYPARTTLLASVPNGNGQLSASPDGTKLYASIGVGYGGFSVVNTTTGSVSPMISGGTFADHTAAYGSDGLYMMNSWSGSAWLVQVSAATGNTAQVYSGRIAAFASNPAGQLFVLVTDPQNTQTSLIRVAADGTIVTLASWPFTGFTSLTADASTVYAATVTNGTKTIYRASQSATGQTPPAWASLPCTSTSKAIAITADALYTVAGNGSQLDAVDTTTGKVTYIAGAGGSNTAAAGVGATAVFTGGGVIGLAAANSKVYVEDGSNIWALTPATQTQNPTPAALSLTSPATTTIVSPVTGATGQGSISSDGKTMYLPEYTNGWASVDLATGTKTMHTNIGYVVRAASYGADGVYLLTSYPSSSVYVSKGDGSAYGAVTGLGNIHAIATDPAGNLFIAAQDPSITATYLDAMTPDGRITTLATLPEWNVYGLAADTGTLYALTSNGGVEHIYRAATDQTGQSPSLWTTVSGSGTAGAMTVTADKVYTAAGGAIEAVDRSTGAATYLAGDSSGANSTSAGTGASAQFSTPYSLGVAGGSLYLVDATDLTRFASGAVTVSPWPTTNTTVAQPATVSTLAPVSGATGQDALSPDGKSLYVPRYTSGWAKVDTTSGTVTTYTNVNYSAQAAPYGNDGVYLLTTYPNSSVYLAKANGSSNALVTGISAIQAIASNPAGQLFISVQSPNQTLSTIQAVSPDGLVTTLGTVPDRQVTSLAADAGTVYALTGTGVLYRLSQSSTGQSATAWVTLPATSYTRGLAVTGTTLWAVDAQAIERVDLGSGTYTVAAGALSTGGNVDGTGSAARFTNPNGLAAGGGAVYVTDQSNNAIRVLH